MKTMQKLFARVLPATAVLALLLTALGPRAEAQGVVGPGYTKIQQVQGMPWQFGGDWKFNSASTSSTGFDLRGISYYRVLWVPVGTMSSCALSIDSAAAVDPVLGTLVSPTTGGVLSAGTIGSCVTAGEYVTTGAAGITAYGQITPTIVGTGSVIVVVFGYTDNPAAGAAGGGGGGGGGAVTQSGIWTVFTQPAGFAAVLGGQQAVTAAAVALPSNATHTVCVKALAANAIDIFVGPSGTATTTGWDLSPGDSICYGASNSNLVYVIASTTGASISWAAN